MFSQPAISPKALSFSQENEEDPWRDNGLQELDSMRPISTSEDQQHGHAISPRAHRSAPAIIRASAEAREIEEISGRGFADDPASNRRAR